MSGYSEYNDVSDGAIQSALNHIQEAYGRPQTWAARAFDAWSGSIRRMPELDDAELSSAVVALSETQATPPSLAALLEFLRARVRGKWREVKGCADCSGSGFRAGAWHHYDTQGHLRVDQYACSCDCPKGQRLQAAHPNWRDVLDRWRGMGRDVTVAAYMTSASHPSFTDEERMTPGELAAHKLRARGGNLPSVEAWRASLTRVDNSDKERTRKESIRRETHWTESADDGEVFDR